MAEAGEGEFVSCGRLCLEGLVDNTQNQRNCRLHRNPAYLYIRQNCNCTLKTDDVKNGRLIPNASSYSRYFPLVTWFE